MKNIRNILIILIIAFIFIILMLLVLLSKQANTTNNYVDMNNDIEYNQHVNIVNENNLYYGSYENGGDQIIIDTNVKAVTNETKFYTVSNCVQKYLDSISQKDSSTVYDILSKEYTSINNITSNNVLEYLNINKTYNFTPLNMNVLEGENTEVYSVRGKILGEDEVGLGEDMFFIVNMCTKNLTFSIKPLNKNYTSIDQIKLENDDSEIIKNDNNIYSYYRIKEEEVAKKYFNYLKRCMIYDQEQAFVLLDNNYKEKRFQNIENFKKYLEDNKFNITRSTISKYSKGIGNSYVVIDNYGQNYIFVANAVMQYKVKLDSYTIETEEYKKSYNSATDEGKAKTNANKFISMINNKDYKNAYALLNTTFKNNNYNTLDKFTSLIKDKMFDINKVESNEVSENGEYYVCDIELSDYKGESNNNVSIQIIVKLGEETNFELSFSFIY